MVWIFQTPIDDVQVGHRCLVRAESLKFVPKPDQRGCDYMVDEYGDYGHAGSCQPGRPLREHTYLKASAHFDEAATPECVEVIRADLDYEAATGHIVVRFERDSQRRSPRQYDLVVRTFYRICNECGGDGLWKGSVVPKGLRCLGCSDNYYHHEPGFRLFDVFAFANGRTRTLVDIDGVWPALPDLKEDRWSPRGMRAVTR